MLFMWVGHLFCSMVHLSVNLWKEYVPILSALKMQSCPLFSSQENRFWQRNQKRWIPDPSWRKSDGFSQRCRDLHLILYLKYYGGSKPNQCKQCKFYQILYLYQNAILQKHHVRLTSQFLTRAAFYSHAGSVKLYFGKVLLWVNANMLTMLEC